MLSRRAFSLSQVTRVLALRYVRFYSNEKTAYKYVKTSLPKKNVGLGQPSNYSFCVTIIDKFAVTIHHPKALNSLSSPLMQEVQHALGHFDASTEVGAMVLTGSEKAFAGKVLPITVTVNHLSG